MPTWRAPGEHVEKGVVLPPTANQGCSSAQWVPMEELEGGYDHSFRHRGVLGTPPRPSCTHACTTGAVTVGAKNLTSGKVVKTHNGDSTSFLHDKGVPRDTLGTSTSNGE